MTEPVQPTTDTATVINPDIVMPEPKRAISLRIDADIIDWFRARGPGYQTRMNAVLGAYVEQQLRSAFASTITGTKP